MSKLSKNVLEKINKQGIKPIPRWRFLLYRILMWLLIAFSILIGSLAMGIVIKEISGTEWLIVDRISRNGIPGIILVIPYFWVLVLGLAVFLTEKVFEHTRSGYKIKPIYTLLGVLILSFIFGFTLNSLRAVDEFEQTLFNNVKLYQKYRNFKENAWLLPKKGILIGQITKINNSIVKLTDANNNNWYINFKNDRFSDQLKIGGRYIILGEMKSKNEFDAFRIRQQNRIPKRIFEKKSENVKEN